MNSWMAWAALVLLAVMLGMIGRDFSLSTLRVVASVAAAAGAEYLTWYGFVHPSRAPASLPDAFTRGADALAQALFHPGAAPPGYHFPGPGRVGWTAITIALVLGYRELEAWSWHSHARFLDTSALADDQQSDASVTNAKHLTDKQRHDRLAAELKFRLPAVEVRSPAILPGGSRSSGLASIAEASGIEGSGLAGAIIGFFGMLWPGPRRVQVRVWVERIPGHEELEHITRVTVDLEDPRTGVSIETKTLAAANLDDAASEVAGYVARYIFEDDRTAPPWCTGTSDGRDLAAMLRSRQVRVFPETQQRIGRARNRQIEILKGVAANNLCAGVTRYELAQLQDLEGNHADALLLHAINRERYPRFRRGRYRLAMSLEMLANPAPERMLDADEVKALRDALNILDRCGARPDGWSRAPAVALDDSGGLPAGLRAYLLDTAWKELDTIRRYLAPWRIAWETLRHGDERAILRPYWRWRTWQGLHDGACLALLLVAVRRALIGQEHASVALAPAPDWPRGLPYRLPSPRKIDRIAAAIAGDTSALMRLVSPDRPGGSSDAAERRPPPLTKSLRTRHWPRQRSTPSWQAAYNLACAYAAITQACDLKSPDQPELGRVKDHVTGVITSLQFAVCNPECEMERPSEWIANDPDFGCIRDRNDDFREFLDGQRERDYPGTSPRRRAAPEQPGRPVPERTARLRPGRDGASRVQAPERG